jgi:hypothetical protein
VAQVVVLHCQIRLLHVLKHSLVSTTSPMGTHTCQQGAATARLACMSLAHTHPFPAHIQNHKLMNALLHSLVTPLRCTVLSQVWLVLELCTGGSLKDAVSCGRIGTSSCQDLVSSPCCCYCTSRQVLFLLLIMPSGNAHAHSVRLPASAMACSPILTLQLRLAIACSLSGCCCCTCIDRARASMPQQACHSKHATSNSV